MKGMPDTENVGIMQGFMDAFDDDDLEGDEDEEGMAETMERRPDSPEILMNNLRGDMRSIDARREELADLVGYAAASETPEPVLAMLQPVLAQQGGGGIGGLPQSAPMAQGPQPPMAMPPGPPPADQGGIAALMGGAPPGGGMPPGPPPGPPGGGMPAPIGMAKGGLVVQRFQVGSDEDGVTPAEEETPSAAASGRFFDPQVQAAIRQRIQETLAATPQAVPDVKALYEQKLPAYRALLGDSRDLTQAQMLFDLAQRGFGFAANVDERGRPLRGSLLSRAAGAVQGLPAVIGARLGELEKGERAVKTAALGSAEKEVENIKRMNQQLEARRDKLVSEVGKLAIKESADERRERLVREGLESREKLTTLQQEGANLRAGLQITSRERMQQEGLAAAAQRQVQEIEARLQNTQLGIDARKALQDQLIAARKQADDADRASRELIASERNVTTRLNAVEKNATLLQIATQRGQSAMNPGFGRGLTASTLNIFTSMAPDFGAGTTNPEQDRVFEAAVTDYLNKNKATGPDALGNPYIQYPPLMPFVVTALKARNRLELIPETQGGTFGKAGARIPGADATSGTAPSPGATAATPAISTTPPPAAAATPAPPPGPPRPPLNERPVILTPEERSFTLFNMAGKGTGIVPVTSAFVAKFPALGDLAPGEQQAVAFIKASANQLTRALYVGDRFTEGERKQIQNDLEVLPKLIDNPESFRNRLLGIDAALQGAEQRAFRSYTYETLPQADLRRNASHYNDIRQLRGLLGVVDIPRVERSPTGQELFNTLPAGSWFVFNGPNGPVLRQKTR